MRLEVLPDDLLPQSGPGRAAGNFVLNELRVDAAPLVPRPIVGRFVRIEIHRAPRKFFRWPRFRCFPVARTSRWPARPRNRACTEKRPQRAIDNNTDGNYEKQSVTHTADGDNPWWEVDLGRACSSTVSWFGIARTIICNRD